MKKTSALELARKLGKAKIRILRAQPFFGLLLMRMNYCLDESCVTAATDGKKIIFAPDFLGRLAETEIDFVLLHEILHAALGHCFRKKGRSAVRFNMACDIVVNDTIKDQTAFAPINGMIDGAPFLSGSPDGRSGSKCSCEEVYDMLPDCPEDSSLDNHALWGQGDAAEQSALAYEWKSAIIQAALAAEMKSQGHLPLLAQRLLEKLRKPRLNWRRLLCNFIRQETFDYSFVQPDRRFQNVDCILPGWYDTRPQINILFALDASGSMSDREVADVFSELTGAAAVCGANVKVSFFDDAITEPIACTLKNLARLKPKGNGGTNFNCIFNLLNSQKTKPDLLVIMTDGCADFPPQSAAGNIPVLWVINNEEVEVPWGKVARLEHSAREI